jgi:hypothetical protein
VKQRDAERLFQDRDALADKGGRHAQLGRRRGEAGLAGREAEDLQVAELNVELHGS